MFPKDDTSELLSGWFAVPQPLPSWLEGARHNPPALATQSVKSEAAISLTVMAEGRGYAARN